MWIRMVGKIIIRKCVCFCVGPEYAHAEARKSPALDGVVERDKEGKELRFPIILNNIEKLISRRVCIAFKVRNFCQLEKSTISWKIYDYFLLRVFVSHQRLSCLYHLVVHCSKRSAVSIYYEPTVGRTSATSTAFPSSRIPCSTTTTLPRSWPTLSFDGWLPRCTFTGRCPISWKIHPSFPPPLGA